MITEHFLRLSLWINQLIAGMMPPSDETDTVLGYVDGWQVFLAWVGGAGYWVNFPALMIIAGAVSSLYAVAVTVRLLRAVIGHVPGVGGNG